MPIPMILLYLYKSQQRLSSVSNLANCDGKAMEQEPGNGRSGLRDREMHPRWVHGGWRVYAQGTGKRIQGGNTNMIARETMREIREYKPSSHDMITKPITL